MAAAVEVSRTQRRLVRQLLEREDYRMITSLVTERAKVLDLGCGDGALLEKLAQEKHADVRGVERDGAMVRQAISRGVTVYQGDIDSSLADYPDAAFDFVILSQTLQQMQRPLPVLREMLRIGTRIIVAFPNFGHWRVRWSHLTSGRSPRTPLFPYAWYNTPNIHLATVEDFRELARDEGWTIEKEQFLAGNKLTTLYPNLLAEVAIFVVTA